MPAKNLWGLHALAILALTVASVLTLLEIEFRFVEFACIPQSVSRDTCIQIGKAESPSTIGCATYYARTDRNSKFLTLRPDLDMKNRSELVTVLRQLGVCTQRISPAIVDFAMLALMAAFAINSIISIAFADSISHKIAHLLYGILLIAVTYVLAVIGRVYLMGGEWL